MFSVWAFTSALASVRLEMFVFTSTEIRITRIHSIGIVYMGDKALSLRCGGAQHLD